jgi:hypothetical protein
VVEGTLREEVETTREDVVGWVVEGAGVLDDVWTGALEEEGAREVVVLSVVVVVSAGGLWGCEDGVVSPELDGLGSGAGVC